jgi:hypothetical protein
VIGPLEVCGGPPVVASGGGVMWPVCYGDHLVSLLAQGLGDKSAHGRFLVEDQDAGWSGHRTDPLRRMPGA